MLLTLYIVIALACKSSVFALYRDRVLTHLSLGGLKPNSGGSQSVCLYLVKFMLIDNFWLNFWLVPIPFAIVQAAALERQVFPMVDYFSKCISFSQTGA